MTSTRTPGSATSSRRFQTIRRHEFTSCCRGNGKLDSNHPRPSRKPRSISRAKIEGAHRMHTLQGGGRSLIVFHSSNPFSIFARPGSRFSSRSIKSPQHLVRSRSAARSTTSFPDVSANSRPSCAVTYILAPLGKHSVRLVSNRNLRMLSVTQLWNLATGKARLSAICCEGLRQVCALTLLAPCHGQNASRSSRPLL